MLPKAEVQHHVLHRTRFHFPEKKGDVPFFAALAVKCVHSERVNDVQTHPVTGSMVVYHSQPLAEFTDLAEAEGWFKTSLPSTKANGQRARRPKREKLSREFFLFLRDLDKTVKESSDDRLDLFTCVALGLLGLSALQYQRGKWLPAGLTLLFQAGALAARSAQEPLPTDPTQ